MYATGLRDKGLLAPAYANAMLDLVQNHPVLRRPDTLAIPDPLEGEKRYAAGLNLYFARRYADAEKELLSAVENDNGDARYYYFLGLSRMAQGKTDAAEDFDQAARLERQGRPDRGTVSRALERVQGPMRNALNDVRDARRRTGRNERVWIVRSKTSLPHPGRMRQAGWFWYNALRRIQEESAWGSSSYTGARRPSATIAII